MDQCLNINIKPLSQLVRTYNLVAEKTQEFTSIQQDGPLAEDHIIFTLITHNLFHLIIHNFMWISYIICGIIVFAIHL